MLARHEPLRLRVIRDAGVNFDDLHGLAVGKSPLRRLESSDAAVQVIFVRALDLGGDDLADL